MFLAPRIVKYVNMYSRATGIESQSTKGAQVFTQPARGSNAPFTDVSLAPVANAFAVFMTLSVAEYREATAKRIRGKRILPRQLSAIGVSAHAADLCLPRDSRRN